MSFAPVPVGTAAFFVACAKVIFGNLQVVFRSDRGTVADSFARKVAAEGLSKTETLAQRSGRTQSEQNRSSAAISARCRESLCDDLARLSAIRGKLDQRSAGVRQLQIGIAIRGQVPIGVGNARRDSDFTRSTTNKANDLDTLGRIRLMQEERDHRNGAVQRASREHQPAEAVPAGTESHTNSHPQPANRLPHVPAGAVTRSLAKPNSTRRVSKSLVNFVVDVVLLLLVVALLFMAAALRFVFPAPSLSAGWTLWGFGFDAWANLEFGLVAVFGLAILLHVMLHWSWVCGVVVTQVLRRVGSSAKLDEGLQTIYGVGLLILVVNIIGLLLGIAYLTIQGPAN